MKLEDGTYISFWPQGTGRDPSKISDQLYEVEEISNRTFADDVRGEYGNLPDHTIKIANLNITKVNSWWTQWQADNKWSTLSCNCSTTVAKALMAGGKPSEFEMIWDPADVKRYANRIKDE